MKVTYPVFILTKDDLSIVMCTKPRNLNICEKIDINDNLYDGWDSKGYPLVMTWDKKIGPVLNIIQKEPQINRLREAIYDYAKRYNTKESFVYSGSDNDVITLFNAVATHVKKAEPKRFTIVELIRRWLKKNKGDKPRN